jgi:signal transduction histidine kinase
VTLLSTLRGRIFLASATVAVLCLAVALRFATAQVAREAEAELRRGLLEAADLVEQHYRVQAETLALTARLVADLPTLKAAVDTADPTTVRPLAEDYRGRARADYLAVTDRQGRGLVAVGRVLTSDRVVHAVAGALQGRETTAFGTVPGGLLQVVTVPIAIAEPPEVMGTLSLGYALDAALAARFRAVTGSEIAFVQEGRAVASTVQGDLGRLLHGGGVVTATVDGNEYVAVRRHLDRSPGAPEALILRSRTERLAFLRPLRTGLLAATAVAVALAIVFSYAVARTVTRPLADVTAAMREMAATGDLTRKIALRPGWQDEDGVLLAHTFNTLTDSIARFQREGALKERLSALGRLSTVIAHEVRNPLMVLKASLRTLRREDASPEDRREAAQDIDHEVDRLNRVVTDVLDFARPIRLDYALLDVNRLCQEAAAAAQGGDAGAGLRVDVDPGLPAVTTDGERLRTALVNVLANAREAAAAGTLSVTLRTTQAAPGRIAIEVQDAGPGIAAGDLPHVFDPYFTTKRTGTGLGLAIAKNLVEAMGGAISVRSRPGEGATVRIELPVERPA